VPTFCPLGSEDVKVRVGVVEPANNELDKTNKITGLTDRPIIGVPLCFNFAALA